MSSANNNKTINSTDPPLHLEDLEAELKQLQLELSDALKLNDQLSLKIDLKELELLQKEVKRHLLFKICIRISCYVQASLKNVKEKISADLEQLEIELTSISEQYTDKIHFHENELYKLRIQSKLFHELSFENEEIKKAINSLEQQISSERHSHSLAMHDMNKSMRLLRQNMEAKLKKDLTAVDIHYQREAFNGLPEDKKKAMFENAKLKDEVSLQGIGMANLGSRLTRQTYHFENCQKEWKALNKKSNALREKLCDLTLVRNSQTEEQQKIEAEIDSLITEQQSLITEIDEWPSAEEWQRQKEECLKTIRGKNEQIQLWEKRKQLFTALLDELKPSNKHEFKGHFSAKIFSFDHQVISTLPSNTRRKTINGLKPSDMEDLAKKASSLSSTTKSSVSEGIKPADLLALNESDAEFAQAMLPLKGKEGYLMKTYPTNGEGGDGDQNMVAWIVLQILHLWRQTASENRDNLETEARPVSAQRKEEEGLFEQSTDTWGSSLFDDPLTSSIEMPSTLELDSSDYHVRTSHWLRKIPELQRIPPPDMHLTNRARTFRSSNVFLTALQMQVSDEVGPPVLYPLADAGPEVLPPLASSQSGKVKDAAATSGTPLSPVNRRSHSREGFVAERDPLLRSNKASKTTLHPLQGRAASLSAPQLTPIHKIREAADRRSKTTALNFSAIETNMLLAKTASAIRPGKGALWGF